MLTAKLQAGESVTYTEHGNSMTPRLKDGVKVTVAPCKLEEVAVGDIVFCRVGGAHFLHMVKAVGQDGRVQIANAHGHINGWTRQVYGKLVYYINPG